MPYYSKLTDLLSDVQNWADLRREQGADVDSVVKRLKKELKRAHKDLVKARIPKKALLREPNDLDAIRALRPEGSRKLLKKFPRASLAEKLQGAWLGRAAGCTLGAPVENWTLTDMERLAKRCGMDLPPIDYWGDHPWPEVVRYDASTMRDYLKGHMKGVPVDDDLTYTLLGLIILEEYGPDFTVEQVGEAWVKYLPVACTAEDVALRNLKNGVPAMRAGEKDNPFQEWIGADIRSDPWAYAAPGWPEKAAELAWRDAYLSHRQNGLYGAMYFAAAISAAFVVNDPTEALRVGLTEIPKDCRLARDVRWALDLAPQLNDWREARKVVDERFPGMHPVHTNNNACLTIFGLLLGQGDFTKTIGITVAMGLDNDCTAATAGSLLGAIIGAKGVPSHWWKPFRNRTRTYLREHEWFSNDDIVERFVNVAKKVWAA